MRARTILLTFLIVVPNGCTSESRQLAEGSADLSGTIMSAAGVGGPVATPVSGLVYSEAGLEDGELDIVVGASSIDVNVSLYTDFDNQEHAVGFVSAKLPLESQDGDLASLGARVCVCSDDEPGCSENITTDPDPAWCEDAVGTFSQSFDASDCRGDVCARNLDATLTMPNGARFSGTVHVVFEEYWAETSSGCGIPTAGPT